MCDGAGDVPVRTGYDIVFDHGVRGAPSASPERVATGGGVLFQG